MCMCTLLLLLLMVAGGGGLEKLPTSEGVLFFGRQSAPSNWHAASGDATDAVVNNRASALARGRVVGDCILASGFGVVLYGTGG